MIYKDTLVHRNFCAEHPVFFLFILLFFVHLINDFIRTEKLYERTQQLHEHKLR